MMSSLSKRNNTEADWEFVAADDGTLQLHGVLPRALVDVLARATLDDPALVMSWRVGALLMMAASINAGVGVARPTWLPAGVLSADQLKAAMMDYIDDAVDFDITHFDSNVVAPLTLEQYGCVTAVLALLCVNPFMVAAFNANPNQEPIAKLGFVSDGKGTTTVELQRVPMPALGFVRLFTT